MKTVYIYSVKKSPPKNFFIDLREPDWFHKPDEAPSIEKWVAFWKYSRWIIVPSHRKRGVRTQIAFVACMDHVIADGIEIDLFVVPRKQRAFGVRFVSLPDGLKHVGFPLLVFDDLSAGSGRWFIGQI